MALNPNLVDLQDLLRSEVYNHLSKVARIYASSGKCLIEYKQWPEGKVGQSCLKRVFSYDDPVNTELVTGIIVSTDTWTSDMEDLACPPLTSLQLTAEVVEDGSTAGTKVADICSVGGKPEFVYAITADPSSKFTITNTSELRLSDTAAIGDGSYSVTIMITDDEGATATETFTITVVGFAQQPVPISTNGNVEILQAVHDFVNVNANIQVGDVDVSSSNPVPITGTVTANPAAAGPIKVTGDTVTATSASFPTAANQSGRVALNIRNTDSKDSIWIVNTAGISLAAAGADVWEVGAGETLNTDFDDTNKVILVAESGKTVAVQIMEIAT